MKLRPVCLHEFLQRLPVFTGFCQKSLDHLPPERPAGAFNDLTRMLGGASKRMVDQRLKELEAADMVIRKVISKRPVAVTYELTEFGRSALKILDDLRIWSEKHNV